MHTSYIPTDESLRSTLTYGTNTFPFACYFDEIEKYDNQCIDWHWHREFEFSLAVKGSVFCRIGNEMIHLHENDGLFINSGIIHRFEARQGGTLINMIFSPEFIAPEDSELFRKYVQPYLSADVEYYPFYQKTPRHGSVLRPAAEISGIINSDTPLKELMIHNQVSLLWEALIKNTENPGDRKKYSNKLIHARLQKMLEFIHFHYPEPVTLSDIASAANVSRSEALRCFHTGIQTTPVNYLNNYRLTRAKEQLLSTNNTVTSIALSSGFERAGYFCRVFKEKYGCPPNKFRRGEISESGQQNKTS